MIRDWKPADVATFDAETKRMRDAMLHPMHRDNEQTQAPAAPLKPDYKQGEGGDAKLSPEESREVFNRYNAARQAEQEAHLRTPEGEKERQARNAETLARLRQARGGKDDVEPSELPHEHAEVEKAARREEGLRSSGQAPSPEREATAGEHAAVLRRAANVLEEKL